MIVIVREYIECLQIACWLPLLADTPAIGISGGSTHSTKVHVPPAREASLEIDVAAQGELSDLRVDASTSHDC